MLHHFILMPKLGQGNRLFSLKVKVFLLKIINTEINEERCHVTSCIVWIFLKLLTPVFYVGILTKVVISWMYKWSQIPSSLLHKIINDTEKVWECYRFFQLDGVVVSSARHFEVLDSWHFYLLPDSDGVVFAVTTRPQDHISPRRVLFQHCSCFFPGNCIKTSLLL